MVRRAQVSFEFLMVVGIAMLLMTSTAYFVFDWTQTQTDQSSLQQAAQIGYAITNQAANMYVYGQGSFITMTGSMPQNIHEIYVVDNKTLIFELATQRGIVPIHIFSDVPINGTRTVDDKSYITQAGTSVHPGNTDFRIESQGDWVQIQQAS